MKQRLRLVTNQESKNTEDQAAPAPISFRDAQQRAETHFPFRGSDGLVDDVLQSLDELSLTLDDLRREIDSLDDDDEDRPTPAA